MNIPTKTRLVKSNYTCISVKCRVYRGTCCFPPTVFEDNHEREKVKIRHSCQMQSHDLVEQPAMPCRSADSERCCPEPGHGILACGQGRTRSVTVSFIDDYKN